VGVGSGIVIKKAVPRRLELPPRIGWAPNPRFVEKPFNVANPDTGGDIPNAELAVPVDMGIDDWLESAYFPYGFLELVRSNRSQRDGSVDIERSLAHLCLCLTHAAFRLTP
jgi:hypothetical protein